MAGRKGVEKALKERTVFGFFLGEMGWSRDDTLIQNREPPEPDILYNHSVEGPIAFELAEICSEDFAQALSTMDPANPPYMRGNDPTPSIVLKKMRKVYATPYPVELILYRGRSASPDDAICSAVKTAAGSCDFRFRKIWIMADKLWVYQQDGLQQYSPS